MVVGGGIGNDGRPSWSSCGGVSNPSLAFNPKKTSPRPLASTILLSSALPLWQDALQRSLVSFRQPSASLPLPQPHPRSPPLHRGSPSFSNSSLSLPRWRRSPSFSPRDHERDRRSRRRDSRSPPPRRRGISSPPPPRGRSPSRSPDQARRTRKGYSLSSERSPPPPRRKRCEWHRRQNRSRSRGAENGRGASKGHLAGAGAGAEVA